MIVNRARCVFPAGLLSATLGLIPCAPVQADQSVDRVQDWLAGISASVASADYRLSWGGISTSLFGGDVTVRDLHGAERGGRQASGPRARAPRANSHR